MRPEATLTLGHRVVGGGSPTYIIAEVGSNHDGDRGRALELIDGCSEAGADAVKFQLFRASTLYPSNCGLIDMGAGPVDFYRQLESLEVPYDWLPDLAERARSRGTDLLVSPFDLDAVDRCEQLGLPALKVASPELSHLPLLRHMARTGLPTLLSTGMATLGDIEEALITLGEGNDRVALMHCVTAYPAPEEQANLRALPTLENAFGLPVGLSDHTLDPIAAPMVAAALGGSVLEKHVTDDRASDGPDHPFAIEIEELAALIGAVREVESRPPPDRLRYCEEHLGEDRVARLLGDGKKVAQPSEAMLATCDRRAIHSTRAIRRGETIDAESVAILRGERNLRPGLHPRHLDQIVGAIAQREVEPGAGLEWEDVIARSVQTRSDRRS